MGILIAVWVFVGLVCAFESAMIAHSQHKFVPIVDLVLIPLTMIVLGPIPLLARMLHRRGW